MRAADSEIMKQLVFEGSVDCAEFEPHALRPDFCRACTKKLVKHKAEAITLESHVKAALEYSQVGPSEIMKQGDRSLYLGGINVITKTNCLQKLSIRFVVNAAKGLNMFGPKYINAREKHQKAGIEFLDLELVDAPEQELTNDVLERSCIFIHKALNDEENGASVVVHCAQGKSRSSSIVIAYLMALRSKPFSETLEFVKTKRMMAKPNAGFSTQLKDWFKSDAFYSFQKELGVQLAE